VILGLCDGHDAGAALVEDGALVFAVSEERLSRQKNQCGFPTASIRAALEFAGGPGAIESVAVAEVAGRLPTRLFDARYRRGGDRGALGLRARALSATSRLVARHGPHLEPQLSAAVLDLRLRRLGVRATTTLIDHHRCHARTAAMGIRDGLAITLDAFGDALSGTVSRVEGGRLSTVDSLPAPQSPALLFAQTTQLLGFGEGEEGKVVARAAHGDPAVLRGGFGKLLALDGQRFVGGGSMRDLRRMIAENDAVDVAAALQAHVEGLVVAFVEEARRRHGGGELGLAGGLFANVAVNRELVPGWERMFVFPAMGDAGLCAGAAWELAERTGQRLRPFEDARIGPTPGPLPDGVATVESVDAAAQELLEGEVLVRCSGRLEFGPRALGHRSLLLRADRPDRAALLNDQLGRDPMMPFGPVMTDEAAAELLDDWTPAVHPMTRWMTVALPASDRLRQLAPGAVHRDGTARAQVITPQDDPSLFALLQRLPGQLCINTSLNRHGEPIACTAVEAVSVARAVGARVWA
jgi:carbamoyltransferase